ncbi:unnamed protein product [Cochlearia groenlandica]
MSGGFLQVSRRWKWLGDGYDIKAEPYQLRRIHGSVPLRRLRTIFTFPFRHRNAVAVDERDVDFCFASSRSSEDVFSARSAT